MYIFPSALKRGSTPRSIPITIRKYVPPPPSPHPSNHPHPTPTPIPGSDVKHNDSRFLNSTNSNTLLSVVCVQIQIVLVQEKRNSNALSMELRLSYTNPSQCLARRQLLWRCVHSCTFRAQIVCPVNGGE